MDYGLRHNVKSWGGLRGVNTMHCNAAILDISNMHKVLQKPQPLEPKLNFIMNTSKEQCCKVDLYVITQALLC